MRSRISFPSLLGALVVLALSSLHVGDLTAQSEVDAAAAQRFFGIWELTLETVEGDFPVMLSISERDGKVAAEFGTGDERLEITDLSVSEESLIARYDMEYQGMEMPVVVRLLPDGDNLKTDWDFADGMYAVSATATRY